MKYYDFKVFICVPWQFTMKFAPLTRASSVPCVNSGYTPESGWIQLKIGIQCVLFSVGFEQIALLLLGFHDPKLSSHLQMHLISAIISFVLHRMKYWDADIMTWTNRYMFFTPPYWFPISFHPNKDLMTLVDPWENSLRSAPFIHVAHTPSASKGWF